MAPLLALLCLTALPAPARAQAAPVAEAMALRDRGQLGEAASRLRAHLTVSPDDGDAARLLAQTLYWMGDVAGAREVYDAALARHPQDSRVRLEFARMFAETGDRAAARALLATIRTSASGAAADALLGRLAYWEGDLSEAARLFETALSREPGLTDARRQLDEIRTLAAPWIRIGTGLRRDDQPLTRLMHGIEAGWFATPLTPVRVNVEPVRFRSSAPDVRLWQAEASVSHAAPRQRLETTARLGLLTSSGAVTTWTGSGQLGVRLSPTSTLGVELRRSPYLWTTSSVDGSVVPTTLRAQAGWKDNGGQAEAAVERQWFADDNAVTVAYAWVLAPVLRGDRVSVQAGYAYSFEDARESRFDLTGRYVPYYTPEERQTHGAIGAVALGRAGGPRISLNGMYSLRTTEQAPGFAVVDGAAVRTPAPRRSHPWNLNAGVEVPIGNRLTLAVAGEIGKQAFYDWRSAGVSVVYRLVPQPAGLPPGRR